MSLRALGEAESALRAEGGVGAAKLRGNGARDIARASARGVGEVVDILRYLLRGADALASRRSLLSARRGRLAKLRRTVDLLRRDNELRARAYLAASARAAAPAASQAVIAFAAAKRALLTEEADWAARERAASAAAGDARKRALAAEAAAVAEARAALQALYGLAGAAARVAAAARGTPATNPALGIADWRSWTLPDARARQTAAAAARRGWTRARSNDLATLGAARVQLRRAREAEAVLRRDVSAKYAAYLREATLLRRARVAAGEAEGAGATGSQLDDALGGVLRVQVTDLMHLVRRMLSASHAAQLSAQAARAANHSNAPPAQATSAHAPAVSAQGIWAMTPAGVAEEITRLDAERVRLEHSRKLLEDELTRRAERAARRRGARPPRPLLLPPGAESQAGATGAAAHATSPPAARALFDAVCAAGGVGVANGTSTGLRHSLPIRRLLAAVGFPQSAADAAAAAAAGAGAGASAAGSGALVLGGMAAGIGGGGLGGCEVCGALRLVARLQRELVRLRRDRTRCHADDSACAPRLDYQTARLAAELRRRRLRVSAEDVELERTLSGVQAALAACEGGVDAYSDAAAAKLPLHCAVAQRIELRRYRDALQAEVGARVRMLQTAALRRQYACLWQFRDAGLTDVVGRVLAPASGVAGGGTGDDEQDEGTIVMLELASAATRARRYDLAAVERHVRAVERGAQLLEVEASGTRAGRRQVGADEPENEDDRIYPNLPAGTATPSDAPPPSVTPSHTASPTVTGTASHTASISPQPVNVSAVLAAAGAGSPALMLPYAATGSSGSDGGPLRKLSVACMALRQPIFQRAADLRECLCADADVLASTRAAAVAAAEARATAATVALDAARQAAEREAAAAKAAREKAAQEEKDRIFAAVLKRPDLAALLAPATQIPASTARVTVT